MRQWLRGLVGWLLLTGPAMAAGTVELTGDFVSEAVFRGASMRQGVSIQPSLRYELVNGLAASVWLNLRLEGSLAITETDYNLDWTVWDRRPVALTLGGIYYDRSDRMWLPSSTELYLGLDFDLPLSPSLYTYWDVDARPGMYWELAGRHRFLMPNYQGTIDLSGALGFDTGRFDGFHDARVSVGFTRYLGAWQIQPSVDLYFPSDRADPGANHFRPGFRFSASRSF